MIILNNYDNQNPQPGDPEPHNSNTTKPEIEQPKPSTVNPSHPQEMPSREE